MADRNGKHDDAPSNAAEQPPAGGTGRQRESDAPGPGTEQPDGGLAERLARYEEEVNK